MLTTSVKSVNLSYSFYARLCQLTFLAFLSWAFVASPAPLLLTCFVFLTLFPYFRRVLSAREPTGLLRWENERTFYVNRDKRVLSHAWTEVAFVGVLLIFEDKSRLFVWRDTCSDEEYRALLRSLGLLGTTNPKEQ
ncbi:protein YgfX [Vibrio nigripulchritudo]|uniref:protein YgfX n=1 Tax=Vibrio nigripulchritudo TaxID=28173 RepID=UPI003CC703AE